MICERVEKKEGDEHCVPVANLISPAGQCAMIPGNDLKRGYWYCHDYAIDIWKERFSAQQNRGAERVKRPGSHG